MTRVTISIEVELAWGLHDLAPDHRNRILSENREEETEALERLISYCEQTETRITFDVVGHLLHEECNGTHAGPHDANWFGVDPGTDVDKNPHFYAPDLVDLISMSPIEHEICTHTYSHILCDEVDEDVLAWEINTAKEMHRSASLPEITSFVAPRHRTPDYDVLAKAGIETIRTPLPSYSYGGSPFKTFRDSFLKRHPSATLGSEGQLVETYCTPHPSLTAPYLQNGQQDPNLAFRLLPETFRKQHHLWYLKDAVRRAHNSDEDVHLWTHLYNLSNDQQLWGIERFLKWLSRYQDQNAVEIVTMNNLA